MSDYDPNLGRTPGGPNRYGQYEYRDPSEDGRSGIALLAVLAGVALVGGFLYFANPQNNTGIEQAQAPAAREQTLQRSPTDAPNNPGPIAPTTTPPGTTATPPGPADTAPMAPRNQE